MPEGQVIERTEFPLTVERLSCELRKAGLASGQTILMHTALSKLNWLVGGPQALITAVLDVITNLGTLVMPTFTAYNTDPQAWQNPPVDHEWWNTVREHMPAFDPYRSPTRGMGVVPELFRTWPGVVRSAHPVTSFAALGPNARFLTDMHALESGLGEHSPLGRLYELDGSVLLLGVGHQNNTSLHLAETRANYRGKRFKLEGSAVKVNGGRQWVRYSTLDYHSGDFAAAGEAFERDHKLPVTRIADADVRFFRQRPCVDFAKVWFEQHRNLP